MFPKGTFGSPFLYNQQSSSRGPSGTEDIKSRTKDSMGINFNYTSQSTTATKNSSSSYSSFSQPSSSHWGHREPKDPYRSTNHEYSNMIEDVASIFGEHPEASKRARMSSDSSHTDSLQQDRSEKSKPKRKRPKFIRKVVCQVCGDVANDHMHYGAIACYSCRAFFRRGVKSNAPYFCSQSQSCVINKQSRKHCQYCRFQKCLSIGMKGSWVMTEEDKIEKKEKAIIRRRWNQIKKFKKDSVGEPISGFEIVPKDEIKSSNSLRNMSPRQQISSPNSESFSQNKIKVQHSDIALKERREFPNDIISCNSDTLILPSAAATARAVVSAAEYNHQLSQLPKLEHNQSSDTEATRFKRTWDWDSTNNDFNIGQSSNVRGNFEERRLGSEPHRMSNEHYMMEIKQELSEMDQSNDAQDPHTPEYPLISTDTLKEYHSDSSDSGRDFSPGGEDYNSPPRRHGRQNLPSLLLKNKGKLEFSSNLINEPVMPFTREEMAIISNVIATEKETTTSMPISNDTLQAIMQAVKTGTSLSYKATLEGYTVCMKRIIKFATRIDLFREFCAHDQKNLLLSNTDMLVNIRSARMLRPGYNLVDQLSVVYGKNKPVAESSKTSVMPIKKRLEYKQVYSSPWASGEDEEQRFFSMMNTIFELQMDQTTTALIAMMALFAQVRMYNCKTLMMVQILICIL